MPQQIKIELIVDDQGTPKVVAFNDELRKTPSVTKDVDKALNDAGKTTNKFTDYMKEQRKENKQTSFVFNQVRDAVAVFGLTLNMAAGSMGKSTEETKKMIATVNTAIVGFQGLNVIISTMSRFLPSLGGPAGLAIAAIGGIALAVSQLSSKLEDATKNAIKNFVDGLKGIIDYDFAGTVKNLEKSLSAIQSRLNAGYQTRIELSARYKSAVGEEGKAVLAAINWLNKDLKLLEKKKDIASELIDKFKEQADEQKAIKEITAEAVALGITYTKGLVTQLEEQQKIVQANFQNATSKANQVKYSTQLESIDKQLTQAKETQTIYENRITAEKAKQLIIDEKLKTGAQMKIAGIDMSGIKFAIPDITVKPMVDKEFEAIFKATMRDIQTYGWDETNYIDEWQEKALMSLDSMYAAGKMSHEAYENDKTRITEIAAKKKADVEFKAAQDSFRKIASSFKQVTNLISGFSEAKHQAEIDRTETERDQKLAAIDAQLSAEGLSEEEKARLLKEREALELEYNAKVKEAKKQAWEAEKESKIIMAIIDTASAIVEALPDIALSIIAGAMGAAQVALIASQPVPKFARGTGLEGFIVPPGYQNDSFPILVQSGERVRVDTPEQIASDTGRGAIVNINFYSPVPHGEWIKDSIQEGLRKTGLTVDKYLINTRNKISLS